MRSKIATNNTAASSEVKKKRAPGGGAIPVRLKYAQQARLAAATIRTKSAVARAVARTSAVTRARCRKAGGGGNATGSAGAARCCAMLLAADCGISKMDKFQAPEMGERAPQAS